MNDQQLQDWLKSKTGKDDFSPAPLSEAERKELSRFDRIWEAANPTASELEVDTNAAWNKLNDRLFADDITAPQRTATVRPMYRSLMRYAAVGGLLLAAGVYYFSTRATLVSAPLEYATAVGETEEVLLPDGSAVTLNEHSSLAYLEANDRRTVTLSGEAFFDVARNEEQPFVITTGELTTTVLGTSFNVRAYPEEKSVEVAVSTGRVEVKDADEEIVLTPEERVTYKPAIKKLSNKQANEVKAAAWVAKELEYDGATLEEMLPALERFYGRKFVVEHPKLLDCMLTARFEKSALQDAITLLEFQFGTIEATEEQVTLKGAGCN